MNPILCEISAPPSVSTDEIGHIAKSCAIDLKLPYPLTIETRASKKIHITLSVDLASAISGEGIWRLASRVASFCPQARVSAQINGIPPEQIAS